MGGGVGHVVWRWALNTAALSCAREVRSGKDLETQHKTPSGPAADTVRTYAAPEAGTHNLPKVTQTGTNPHEATFTYDGAGNTETRKIGAAAAQSLTWDDEGHLRSVTQGSAASGYLYDTAGSRMIRTDSTGTTLYLPEGNELHQDKNGVVTGTRYYSAGADPIAVRKGTKLTRIRQEGRSGPRGVGEAEGGPTPGRRLTCQCAGRIWGRCQVN